MVAEIIAVVAIISMLQLDAVMLKIMGLESRHNYCPFLWCCISTLSFLNSGQVEQQGMLCLARINTRTMLIPWPFNFGLSVALICPDGSRQ